MLHRALLKGYCPVGRVVAYGGGDVESLGQFGIHHHLLSRVEVLHKLAFHALGGISVGEDIIHDALLALVGLVHRGVLLLGEDVAGVFAIHLVVADMIHDDGGFLLHDNPRHLADELLGIHLVEVELHGTYL